MDDLEYIQSKDWEDVEHRFAFHPADTVEKRMDHSSIRFQCRQLAHKLQRDLPAGREKSLAITKLEEAMFWANAAIARQREHGGPTR